MTWKEYDAKREAATAQYHKSRQVNWGSRDISNPFWLDILTGKNNAALAKWTRRVERARVALDKAANQ